MGHERWWADGWELTEGWARDVEVRDGLLQVQTQSQNVQDVNVIGRHGVLDGMRRTYDAGSIVIQAWLLESRWDDAAAAYQELVRAVMPMHRTVHWQHMVADGTIRETWGRTVQALQPQALGNLGVRVSLEVQLPRAFWQDEDATSDDTGQGAAVPGVLALTSKALASAPMVDLAYAMTGPWTNPTVTVAHDPAISDSFTFMGAIPPGATLTVDSGTWEVTAVGMPTPTLDQFSWTGYRLLEVPAASPGVVPTLALGGQLAGSGTRLVVTGRTKYLAAA